MEKAPPGAGWLVASDCVKARSRRSSVRAWGNAIATFDVRITKSKWSSGLGSCDVASDCVNARSRRSSVSACSMRKSRVAAEVHL